jgi:ABC-type multidrug transport system ATPase subunit
VLGVADLHHRFGERTALDGVSISAAPGEIVGLVGRNRAAKTTTMRSIMGIVVPDAGGVLSFVPVMTPTLAPARIAVGHVAAWEIAGQAVVTVLAIYITIRVAARVYANRSSAAARGSAGARRCAGGPAVPHSARARRPSSPAAAMAGTGQW